MDEETRRRRQGMTPSADLGSVTPRHGPVLNTPAARPDRGLNFGDWMYHQGILNHNDYVLARGGRAGGRGHFDVGGAATDIAASPSVALPTTAVPSTAISTAPAVDPSSAIPQSGTQSYLSSLYQTLLGRAPDAGGLGYWADQIDSGNMTRQDILPNFLHSKEYQNLYNTNPSEAVKDLYTTVLDRDPEQAGLDYWIGQAKNGMTADDMYSGFRSSSEAKNADQIANDYLNYTNAYPTFDQMAKAQDQIKQGNNVDDFILNLPESEHYWLDSAYQNILGRAIDSPSEKYWSGRLSDGSLTPDQFLEYVYSSPEAQDYNNKTAISDAFQSYLGRAPTAEEMAKESSSLNNYLSQNQNNYDDAYNKIEAELASWPQSRDYLQSTGAPYQVAQNGNTVSDATPLNLRTAHDYSQQNLWEVNSFKSDAEKIGALVQQEGGRFVQQIMDPNTPNDVKYQAMREIEGIANTVMNRAAVGYKNNNSGGWFTTRGYDPHSVTSQILAPWAFSAMNSTGRNKGEPLAKEGYNAIQRYKTIKDSAEYQPIMDVLKQIVANQRVDITDGGTDYKANYVHPSWAKKGGLQYITDLGGPPTKKQGYHQFYGTPELRDQAKAARGSTLQGGVEFDPGTTTPGTSGGSTSGGNGGSNGGPTINTNPGGSYGPPAPGSSDNSGPTNNGSIASGSLTGDGSQMVPVYKTITTPGTTSTLVSDGKTISYDVPGTTKSVIDGYQPAWQAAGFQSQSDYQTAAQYEYSSAKTFYADQSANAQGWNSAADMQAAKDLGIDDPASYGMYQVVSSGALPPEMLGEPIGTFNPYADFNESQWASLFAPYEMGVKRGGRINKDRGGSVDDALRRMGFSEGGSGPDEDELERKANQSLWEQAKEATHNAYVNTIPSNVRLLGETMMGVDTPITERDFPASDLDAMRAQLSTSKRMSDDRENNLREIAKMSPQDYARSSQAKGRLTFDKQGNPQISQESYEDFMGGVRKKLDSFDATRGKTTVGGYRDHAGLDNYGWKQAIDRSIYDPDFRVATTLGRYQAQDTPNGPVIRDDYNFDKWNTENSEKVDASTLRDTPIHFVDYLMRKYAGNRHRPVQINLQHYDHGGRIGFEDGGMPPEDDPERLRHWSEPQRAHEFVQQQLNSGEKQLPQYDPEGGKKAAVDAALTGYGMTNAGGVQDAIGAMPDGKGGFNPSLYRNIREGNYLDAGLQAMGAVVPGFGGAVAKAGRLAKGAKAAKAVETASTAAKTAENVADAGNAVEKTESKLWKPSAPRIIRPGEEGAPTVGDILAKNGYTDIPTDKGYVHWLDALNEPASKQTQANLLLEFQDALKHHLSLPEGMRRQNTRDAMAAAVPYLGQSEKGVPYDLITQNAKQGKAAAALGITNSYGNPVDTWGLSLSPALNWEALRVCGNDAICRALCLGKKSGGYALEGAMNDEFKMNLPRANSLGRTIFMMQRPREFAVRMADEMRALQGETAKNGMDLSMRLNTLSDLHPTTWSPFRDAYPDVDFYDYTKHNVNAMGPNHHLTYSSTGHSSDDLINPYSNFTKMIDRLNGGDNVAIVMNQKHDKPKLLEYLDRQYEVRDGDAHDYRPHDQQPKGKQGVILALGKKEQGKGATAEAARERSGGFYYDFWPKKDGDKIVIPDQRGYAEAEKAERIRRSKKKGGGGLEVDHDIWRSQYHNHHHFEDAPPGKRKIPDWWDNQESKRKAG
jgi:hypothetical protein